ncbi:MAG TPA: hypothetical protein VGJ16_00425 [Pirellulales bacterium]|jgi:hypothetical protein
MVVKSLPPQADVPRTRVILLGASNVAKAFGTLVETSRRAWGGPLELYAAFGHGRSYGRASAVLGRVLPGILECGLWRAVGCEHEVPTAALVTDIGNDILYESSVAEIAGWLEACLDRLADARANTVVTLLPTDNLATLSPARFRLLRSVFFPRSRITLAEVAKRAHLLNERVKELATARGFITSRQQAHWYGFDSIHIRYLQRSSAWHAVLSSWPGIVTPLEPAGGRVVSTLRLRAFAPHERRVFGIEWRAAQPRARLRDGTTIAIY